MKNTANACGAITAGFAGQRSPSSAKTLRRKKGIAMPFEIKEPTDEQKTVINAKTTAVVAAGAGSGKTTVLAHRFVRLILEEKAPVDTILTLTFTNKATNEMRQRIYKFLVAKREKCEGAEKGLLDAAIHNFYKARIETLDSYCASIVRAASSRYGLSPDFSEDMEKSAAIIEDESLPFIIKYKNHPAITGLYREKTPEAIARDVFAGTIAKHCFLGAPVDFAADFQENVKKITEEWGNLTREIKKKLRELDDAQTEIMDEIKKKKCDPLTVPNIDFDAEDRIKMTEAVYRLYGFAYTSLQKNPAKMLKDHINAIRELFALFAPLAVFIMQKDQMALLCGLLNEFEEIVFERKRREGSLSYADAASLARKILLENKEIRREEKQIFTSIIIDEFQDNNALQRDILYLLAEKPDRESDSVPEERDIVEGKLFFVGDEKQSIYKFRGADVSVFRELQQSFPAGHFTLQTNFRSSHTLIGFFNAVFGGTEYSETRDALPARYPSIFARSAELPAYEAGYVPLQASGFKKDTDGKAVICLFPALNSQGAQSAQGDEENGDDEEADNAETEAVFVAKKIKALKETGQYHYRDMAILVQSHTNEHFFEKHLRILDIPYTNENLNASISIDPAGDIYSFLRLVAYPMDRQAYAETLRSPFAGLSLNGMLAALRDYDESHIPFMQLSDGLDNGDRKKFDLARNLYAAIKNRSINGSIADLIAALWYAKGYRYEVLWHRDTRAFHNGYHLLFSLAVKADNAGKSLALFTETLKKLIRGRRFFAGFDHDKSWLDDLTVPFEKEDAVSIMTIHKSKGLEFPVVFVCGCGNGKKRTENAFVIKTRDNRFTVTPVFPLEFAGLDPKKVKRNYFQENARKEESAKETAELRRLLYVAMTRAEKELYLTGTLKYTKDDTGNNLKELVMSINERKRKKEIPRIAGDTIFDNGTFAGLLLPVIAQRTNEGLFGLEEIPRAGNEDIYGAHGKKEAGGFSNDAEGRGAFIAKARALYDEKRVVNEEKTYRRHQSVTYRKKIITGEMPFRYQKSEALKGAGAADLFADIDALLSNDTAASAEFGTIAHACVEAALKKEPAFIPPLVLIDGKTDGAAAEKLLAAGEEIARRFLASPLGMMAQNAVWVKSETSFRTLEKGVIVREAGDEKGDVFISGTIDLAFEKEGGVFIVDFKTDKTEAPAEHAYQMAAYRKAAQDLWQKETRLFIYYMRTGNAVELETAQSAQD
jgi:ATP-dependent helicase/nuclease subunit A